MDNIADSGLRRRVKIHVAAREHLYLAVVQPGFEHTLAAEMAGAGLAVRPELIEGGVEFTGRIDDLFRACLMLRGASRIVMRLATFRSVQFHLLEKDAAEFPWELYLPCNSRPLFRITSSKSMIWHTDKLEEMLSAAIEERMRTHSGPDLFASPAPEIPQTLIVRNHRDRCGVSLDASGPLLHKRGGDKHVTAAPLRETTAALILMEGGIKDYDLLIDPMCGSGTFSLEAAGIWSGALPAAEREFPFLAWPCFREKHFAYMKRTLDEEVKVPAGKSMVTCDMDLQAVEIARRNVPRELEGVVMPEVADFFSLPPEIIKNRKALVVMNPPYGKRIDQGNTLDLYKRIGEKLRGDFADCGFAVIVPGIEAERALGCRYDRKVAFMNGGLKVAALFGL